MSSPSSSPVSAGLGRAGSSAGAGAGAGAGGGGGLSAGGRALTAGTVVTGSVSGHAPAADVDSHRGPGAVTRTSTGGGSSAHKDGVSAASGVPPTVASSPSVSSASPGSQAAVLMEKVSRGELDEETLSLLTILAQDKALLQKVSATVLHRPSGVVPDGPTVVVRGGASGAAPSGSGAPPAQASSSATSGVIAGGVAEAGDTVVRSRAPPVPTGVVSTYSCCLSVPVEVGVVCCCCCRWCSPWRRRQSPSPRVPLNRRLSHRTRSPAPPGRFVQSYRIDCQRSKTCWPARNPCQSSGCKVGSFTMVPYALLFADKVVAVATRAR